MGHLPYIYIYDLFILMPFKYYDILLFPVLQIPYDWERQVITAYYRTTGYLTTTCLHV